MKKTLLYALPVLALGLVAWLVFALRPTPQGEAIVAPSPGGVFPTGDATAGEPALEAPRDTTGAAPSATANDGLARAASSTAPRASAGDVGDYELKAGHWIEGRVELAPDTPLDEEVWVVADGRDFTQRPKHRAKVGPDGRFRVAFARDTRVGWLRLDARYNYLEEPPPVRTSDVPKEIILRGKLGGFVRGRILIDAAAQARAGEVVAQGRVSCGENEFDFMGFGSKPGRILDDLTYEVGGLEPGTDRHVSVKADGFVNGKSRKFDVEIGRVVNVDVELHVGAVLQGRVVGVDKAPIAGVKISPTYAGDEGFSFFGALEKRLETDAEGRFELNGLKDGEVTLVLQKAGYEPLFHPLGSIAVTTRRSDLEIELGAGLSISGRVLQADGKPVARALVSVLDPEGRDMPSTPEGFSRWMLEEREPVEAAPDGSFRVQGLQPGRYVVSARGWNGPDAAAAVAAERAEEKAAAAEQRANPRPRKVVRRGAPLTARLDDVTAGTENLNLTLGPGDRLRGRVVDQDGKPVERFTVHASPERGSVGFTDDIDDFERLFRSKDGVFTLEGLRPCGWSLHVTARGYMDSSSLPITIPGANEDTTFRLLKQAKLVGVVLDPERKPLAGAKVIASGELGDFGFPGERAVTRTDAKGKFSLVSVPVGSIRVHAEANGHTRSASLRFEIGAGTTREGIELVLSRGGAIRGEVVDAEGKKAAGREVKLNAVGESFEKSSRTDAEGRFAFDALPTARYRVSAEVERAFDFSMLGADGSEADDPSLVRIVDVTEGGVANVKLGRANPSFVRVFGHVRGSARAEEIVATQAATSADVGMLRRQAELDTESAYSLLLPAPGRWHVSIEGGSLGSASEFLLDVPAQAEFEHDFVLPEGSIRGRVVDAEGAGVANMEVRLFGGAGVTREGGQVTSSSDGSYEFKGLSPGTYALRTEDFGDFWSRDEREVRRSARREGVVVKDGAAVEGIDLVVSDSGVVSGFVRGADGSAMPNATIHVFDELGLPIRQRFGARRSDDAGRFQIENLPLGRITIVASTEHSAGKAVLEVRESGTKEVDVALRPNATLVVIVQDERGAPTFAPITLTDEEGCHFEETAQGGGSYDGPPGGRTFRRLPAGRYTATAHGAGGWTAHKDVRLAEGANAEIVLRHVP